MKTVVLSLALACAAVGASAQNPFVQTWFTSDPAPMVHDGTMYVYTGHDEDGADFFWMQEWRVYSSQDMVNWTDHGSPLALESFSWADDRAWAAQTIERGGKFYWYICAHSKLTGGMAIGVAVSDSPTGPFRDALGKPLFDNGSWDHIDPTVMIDDDGQAWLMRNPVRQSTSKRYFLLYAAGGVPEHISYSTAPAPTGPWTYEGIVMPLSDTKSFTNHCGVADFKGHSYFFYHTGRLPKGGGFGRSVAVEEFTYRADGTLPTILPTDAGVRPLAAFNPYARVQAETMAFSQGVKTEQNDQVGVYVTDIHHGDYIKLQHVDFGSRAPQMFTARVASGLRGGQIEVRLDSLGGQLLGTLDVPATGGWEQWQTLTSRLTALQSPISGTHDLFFAFKGRRGPKLFNIDWWQFRQ